MKKISYFLIIVISLFILSSCGETNIPPSIPSNPEPANGETSVPLNPVLSWYTFDEENDEILSYLYFGKSSSPVLIKKDLEVFKYELGTLEPGTTYYWKVVVKDSNGGMAESPIWNFTTTHIPNEPKVVYPENNIVLNNYKEVVLRWEAVDPDNDKLKFDIYFGTNITDLKVLAKDYEKSEYKLPVLKESTTYYWKVIVKDGKGGVKEGAVWSFTTNTTPEIKKLIFPENKQIKVPIKTKFKWEGFDKDNDNLVYYVYLGEKSSNLNLVARTEFEELEISLKPDTKYFWKVIVEDEKGAISESEIYSFTTVFKPSVPINTGIEDGMKNLPLNVLISWKSEDKDSEIIYYDLYFGKKDNLGLIAEDFKDTNYSLKNLEPGTTYYWKVIAKDETGLKSESPIWSFSTSHLPSKPKIISPKNSQKGFSFEKITLEWKSNDLDNDVIYYDLYLGNSSDFLAMILNESTDTKYELQNLKPCTTYYWKVIAYDKKSGEISSDTYSFKTNCPPKFEEEFYPKDGEKNVSTTVLIKWNAQDADNDKLFFDIYFGLKPDKMELIAENYSDYNYTLKDLKEGTKYYWKVLAKDENGGIAESKTFSFETTNSPILKSIYPENGSKISVKDSLKWDFEDPDGDSLVFDIYMGFGDELKLIEKDYKENTYRPLLKPGEKYYWKIVAKDGKGGNVKSSIYEFETNNLPNSIEPIFPNDNQVNVLVENVNLSWKASDPENDELVYDLYFGDINKMNLLASELKATSYNVGNLEPQKIYYWKVVVKDEKSGSIESPVWRFKTENIVFFEDFDDFPVGISPNKTLKWQGEYKTTGDANIIVSYKNNNRFLRIKSIKEIDSVKLSKTINLKNGYIEFDFMIDNKKSSFYIGTFENLGKDNNFEGIGPLVEVVNIDNESYLCVYNSEKSSLEKVYKLRVYKWYKVKIDFSLENSKKYYVYVDGQEVGIGIVDVNNLNYLVISSALSHVSEFSYIDNIKIVKKEDELPPRPSKPILISPTDTALLNSNTVTLNWTLEEPNKDKIYFDIYFGKSKNLNLLKENLSDTNYTITNLTPGKTYYWKVVAKNDLGEISESDTFSFKIIGRRKEIKIVDENFESYPLGVFTQIPWIKYLQPREEIIEITNDVSMGKVLKLTVQKDDQVAMFDSVFIQISEIEEISEGYVEFDAKFEAGSNLFNVFLLKYLGNDDFESGPELIIGINEDNVEVYKERSLKENLLTTLELNKWHHFKIYFKDYDCYFYINNTLYGSYKMKVKNFSAFLISLINLLNEDPNSCYIDNFKIVKIDYVKDNKSPEPSQNYCNLLFEDTFDEYKKIEELEENWFITPSDKNSFVELVSIDENNQAMKITDASTKSSISIFKNFVEYFNNLVLDFDILITGDTFLSLFIDSLNNKRNNDELPQVPNLIFFAAENLTELYTVNNSTKEILKLNELDYERWYNIKIKIYEKDYEIFVDNNSLGKYPFDSSIILEYCFFFTTDELITDSVLIDNFRIFWEN